MSLNFKRVCLHSSFFAGALLFFQVALAQSSFREVDAILQRNQKALGGFVAAMVYKDGKVIYQKELGTDFTIKTQAPIAGSSKWLTAALIMILVDEGKLSLDDPVAKYLPDLNKYMKGYITIRQCLTHTTGIEREQGSLAKIFQRKKFATLDDEAKAIAAKEISNNAGTEFHYGNLGLNLAGRVAEVVSKKNFDQLIAQKLLRPLKMRATSFADDGGGAPNPSAGAKSTAADYMNFLSMILNKGMFEGKRILSEESIAEMQKPQFLNLPVKFAPKAMEGYHYGLGLWIFDEDASGNSLTVGCPGLFGTFPYIDKCRGYAAILFPGKLLPEQKKEIAVEFKTAVDQAVGGGCK